MRSYLKNQKSIWSFLTFSDMAQKLFLFHHHPPPPLFMRRVPNEKNKFSDLVPGAKNEGLDLTKNLIVS